MTETANCKRSTLDLAWRIAPPRPHKDGSRIEKRREQKRGGGHISLSRTEVQALQNENKALKDENRALKKEKNVLKKHAKKYDCRLCRCSYTRSDRLYEHLRKGDSEHQALAQELERNTRCEKCAKNFRTWIGFHQHISRSKQHIAETTKDVIYSEPDGMSPSPNSLSTTPELKDQASSMIGLRDLESTEYTSHNSEQTLPSETGSKTKCLTPALTQSPAFFRPTVTGLDFTSSGYQNSSTHGHAVTSQAAAFFNHQATGLNFMLAGNEDLSGYGHMVISQAPVFSNRIASGPVPAPVDYQNLLFCGLTESLGDSGLRDSVSYALDSAHPDSTQLLFSALEPVGIQSSLPTAEEH